MTTRQKTTVRVFAGFIALYLLLMLSFTSMWQDVVQQKHGQVLSERMAQVIEALEQGQPQQLAGALPRYYGEVEFPYWRGYLYSPEGELLIKSGTVLEDHQRVVFEQGPERYVQATVRYCQLDDYLDEEQLLTLRRLWEDTGAYRFQLIGREEAGRLVPVTLTALPRAGEGEPAVSYSLGQAGAADQVLFADAIFLWEEANGQYNARTRQAFDQCDALAEDIIQKQLRDYTYTVDYGGHGYGGTYTLYKRCAYTIEGQPVGFIVLSGYANIFTLAMRELRGLYLSGLMVTLLLGWWVAKRI